MQSHIVLKPGAVVTTTVTTTAIALTAPSSDTVACILTVEAAAVRMRYDGTSPTTDTGLPMKADSVWEITGRDIINAMEFIAQSTDAKLTRADLKGE